MNCPSCKTELNYPVKFCPKCGQSLETAFQDVLKSLSINSALVIAYFMTSILLGNTITNILFIILLMTSFPAAEKVREIFEKINLPYHAKMVKGIVKIFSVLMVMSVLSLIGGLFFTGKHNLFSNMSGEAAISVLIGLSLFIFASVFFKLYCLWRFMSVFSLISCLSKGKPVKIEPPGMAAYIVSAAVGVLVTVMRLCLSV